MNQNQLLPSSKLNTGDLEVVWLKRRAHAFVVTSFALFMILILSWSFHVRAIRVDNDMRFRLEDSNESTVAQFKSSLLEAMHAMTTDSHLVERISGLRDAKQLDSPHLSKTDLDTIRSKIQVFTKVDPGTNEADVKISFFGYGSEGECRFVKRLSEDVLAFLRPSNKLSEMGGAIADITSHLKEHVANHDRFSSSLKSMVYEVEDKLSLVDSRMRNVWQGTQAPSTTTLADSMLQSYQADLERLKIRQDELFLLAADADKNEIHQLNNQIDHVTSEIQKLQESSNSYGFSKNTTFRNASFSRNGEVDQGAPAEVKLLSELSGEIGRIRTANLISTIEQIDEHRRGNLSAPIEYLEKVTETLPGSGLDIPSVALLGPGTIGTKPIGGKPVGTQIFLLAFLSVAFGSFVVWQLNPKDIDRGFPDVSSLEKTLGVPVISQFQLQSPREIENKVSMAVRLTKICEVVALVVVAMVAISCLLGPEIRTAMLEDPLDGFARIVWHFRKS